MDLVLLFFGCAALSLATIRLSMWLARSIGILDRPGEHKRHEMATPFVGGTGLMVVLLAAFGLAEWAFSGAFVGTLRALVVAALAIFLSGLADDVRNLDFRQRLLIQALVALWMVFVGGVELGSLGELLPGRIVDLGWLAVPMTVFATIGLINAVNMIDGIDGLSGSVSLASLAFTAFIAHYGGNGGSDLTVFLIVALIGGLVGFLHFNLRYPGHPRARVFLGDNGSTLLGFLFAWLLIGLSQGEQAVMTPVTALWLFALPLMDTVGIMLRRLWLGKSPFRPDRHHLHHLFVRAGFRVCDVVVFAAFMQGVFALVGIGGLLLGVPEYVMFWLFLGVFALYGLLILRPWRLVPWLRQLNRRLGMPSGQVRGIFVGHLCQERCPEVLEVISQELGSDYDYRLGLYEMEQATPGSENVYCIVHIPDEGDEHLLGRIQRDARRIGRRLAGQQGVDSRVFLRRSSENDLRNDAGAIPRGGSRTADRRGIRSVLIYALAVRQGSRWQEA
ncbi:MAG: MraY family glycosyltransferase [Candidatus Accumulibacter sp. UW26]|jgi:UDP-GlcNAc:undecaprenyl-phosphate GlcNAc-1-phosphate transferase